MFLSQRRKETGAVTGSYPLQHLIETQLRDGALSLLRQEIADDLEGFLADADADMSGDVSWTEFEECCYRFLGEDRRTHVGPEALKALFDELATGHAPVGGGEGKEHVIVIDTFVEEMNAASLFVRDAGCATKIVFALLAKVRSCSAACGQHAVRCRPQNIARPNKCAQTLRDCRCRTSGTRSRTCCPRR